MSVDLAHIRQVMAEADCLYTEEQVEAAIAKVAETINAELAERNPVVFCVMKGGLIFSGKLVPKLNFPLELSYLHATRYRNEASGGELFWKPGSESGLRWAQLHRPLYLWLRDGLQGLLAQRPGYLRRKRYVSVLAELIVMRARNGCAATWPRRFVVLATAMRASIWELRRLRFDWPHCAS